MNTVQGEGLDNFVGNEFDLNASEITTIGLFIGKMDKGGLIGGLRDHSCHLLQALVPGAEGFGRTGISDSCAVKGSIDDGFYFVVHLGR